MMTDGADRGRSFRQRHHNRYWWHRLTDTDYAPPIFAWLNDAEWSLMAEWFDDTESRFPSPGEVSIPGISLLFGLVAGNGIGAVVQCGHYVGYSTLLLGFLFRRMNKRACLFTIDIDPDASRYTESWIERAGLSEQVRIAVGSSSEPGMPAAARDYLGRDPQLIFIDSSHQYAHTLDELDLWWPTLTPGGFAVLHDVSLYAQSFDRTSQGGVKAAVMAWTSRHEVTALLANADVGDNADLNRLVYRDGCGLGILQKPIAEP